MVMDTLQIRLNHGIVKMVDELVKSDVYANRSEVIRDAVRRFVWDNEAGTISKKGDSVKLVRKAREILSKEKINLEEINNL